MLFYNSLYDRNFTSRDSTLIDDDMKTRLHLKLNLKCTGQKEPCKYLKDFLFHAVTCKILTE